MSLDWKINISMFCVKQTMLDFDIMSNNKGKNVCL